MARGELRQPRADHLRTDPPGVLDDPLLHEDVDGCDRGGTRQRVAGVGKATGEGTFVEGAGDGGGDDHPTEGHIARVHALGKRDQVRNDGEFVDGEPLAATAEAGHDLVGDHHDSELVTEGADAFEVAIGWHEDPVRADDRFEDDRCHGVRPFKGDDVP